MSLDRINDTGSKRTLKEVRHLRSKETQKLQDLRRAELGKTAGNGTVVLGPDASHKLSDEVRQQLADV